MSYLKHFTMGGTPEKGWDSRFVLGQIPEYNALNDRYCKFWKKKNGRKGRGGPGSDGWSPTGYPGMGKPGDYPSYPSGMTPQSVVGPGPGPGPGPGMGMSRMPVQGPMLAFQHQAPPGMPAQPPPGMPMGHLGGLGHLGGPMVAPVGTRRPQESVGVDGRDRLNLTDPGIPPPRMDTQAMMARTHGAPPTVAEMTPSHPTQMLSANDLRRPHRVAGGSGRNQMPGVPPAPSSQEAPQMSTGTPSMHTSEVQQMLDRRNLTVQIEKSIEVREGFLYLLQELTERCQTQPFDREQMSKELTHILNSLRNATLDCVEAVSKYEAGGNPPYLWKGVSYLQKINADLQFLVHSRLATLLDFNVAKNPLLIRNQATRQGKTSGVLPPVKQGKEMTSTISKNDPLGERMALAEKVLKQAALEMEMDEVEEEGYLHALDEEPEELGDDEEVPEEDWLARTEDRTNERERTAANIIQRLYRGFRDRKRYSYEKRMHLAAVKLQKFSRCMRARRIVEELSYERQCLIKIQSWCRAILARVRVRRMKQGHSSAVIIQRVLRGHLSRRRADEVAYIRLAAVAIQKTWRGFRIRKTLKKERTESRQAAAILIQKHWRGYMVRVDTRYNRKKLVAVLTLQSWGRGIIDRNLAEKLRRRWRAVVKIQAFVRGCMSRGATRKWLREREMFDTEELEKQLDVAATRIQSGWRMHQGKKIRQQKYEEHVRRAEEAAAAAAAAAVDEAKEQVAEPTGPSEETRGAAALKIQSRQRGIAARDSVAKLRGLHMTATHIQRIFRGFAGRKIAHAKQEEFARDVERMRKEIYDAPVAPLDNVVEEDPAGTMETYKAPFESVEGSQVLSPATAKDASEASKTPESCERIAMLMEIQEEQLGRVDENSAVATLLQLNIEKAASEQSAKQSQSPHDDESCASPKSEVEAATNIQKGWRSHQARKLSAVRRREDEATKEKERADAMTQVREHAHAVLVGFFKIIRAKTVRAKRKHDMRMSELNRKEMTRHLERQQAACMIQRWVRDMIPARQDVRLRREVRKLRERKTREHAKQQEWNKASRMIACAWKCRIARKRVAAIRKQRDADSRKITTAALEQEAAYQKLVDTEAEKEQAQAATKIQALHRGKAARKEIAVLQAGKAKEREAAPAVVTVEVPAELTPAQPLVDEEMVQAATKIQAVQRGRAARKANVKVDEPKATNSALREPGSPTRSVSFGPSESASSPRKGGVSAVAQDGSHRSSRTSGPEAPPQSEPKDIQNQSMCAARGSVQTQEASQADGPSSLSYLMQIVDDEQWPNINLLQSVYNAEQEKTLKSIIHSADTPALCCLFLAISSSNAQALPCLSVLKTSILQDLGEKSEEAGAGTGALTAEALAQLEQVGSVDKAVEAGVVVAKDEQTCRGAPAPVVEVKGGEAEPSRPPLSPDGSPIIEEVPLAVAEADVRRRQVGISPDSPDIRILSPVNKPGLSFDSDPPSPVPHVLPDTPPSHKAPPAEQVAADAAPVEAADADQDLISLTLGMPHDQFDQEAFIAKMAAEMGVDSADIEITKVEKGSTVVCFRFKTPAAERKADKFLNALNDPAGSLRVKLEREYGGLRKAGRVSAAPSPCAADTVEAAVAEAAPVAVEDEESTALVAEVAAAPAADEQPAAPVEDAAAAKIRDMEAQIAALQTKITQMEEEKLQAPAPVAAAPVIVSDESGHVAVAQQEELAAVQIQTTYRGYGARKEVRRRKESRARRMELADKQQEAAAEKKHARAEAEEFLNHSVVEEELGPGLTVAHSVNVRMSTDSAKLRQMKVLEGEEDRAAVRIQCVYRGHSGRREASRRREARQKPATTHLTIPDEQQAAVRIQCAYRQSEARKEMSERRRLLTVPAETHEVPSDETPAATVDEVPRAQHVAASADEEARLAAVLELAEQADAQRLHSAEQRQADRTAASEKFREDQAAEAERKREDSALAIQCGYRQHKARKSLEAKRQERAQEFEAEQGAEEDQCTDVAAAKIQQVWVKKAPVFRAIRIRAVTKIQAYFRGFKARRVARLARVSTVDESKARHTLWSEEEAMRMALLEECTAMQRQEEDLVREFESKAVSAEAIQRSWKCKQAREEAERRRTVREDQRKGQAEEARRAEAAATIQRAYRCYNAKFEANWRRQQRETARTGANAEKSAVAIQRQWRGFSARARVARMKEEKRERTRAALADIRRKEEQEEREAEIVRAAEVQREVEAGRENAACMIQRCYKCYNARFMLRWKRDERAKKRREEMQHEEQRLENVAATRIQCMYRCWKARQVRRIKYMTRARVQKAISDEEERLETAATKIQCAYRCFNARFEAAWRRERREKLAAIERTRREAAMQEQSVIIARREAELAEQTRREDAALCLQCAWRSYCARFKRRWMQEKRAAAEQERLDAVERQKAASTIQAHQERDRRAAAKQVREQQQVQRIEEARLTKQNEAATKIQCMVRRRHAKALHEQKVKEYEKRLFDLLYPERRNRAAIKIQCMYRCRVAKFELEYRRLLERDDMQQEADEEATTAALKIQALQRGRQGRKKAAEQRAYIEKHGARPQTQEEREQTVQESLEQEEDQAARKIQGAWKTKQANTESAQAGLEAEKAGLEAEEQKEAEVEAATKIQATYKGGAERDEMLQEFNEEQLRILEEEDAAAMRIQTNYKGHLAKKKVAQMRAKQKAAARDATEALEEEEEREAFARDDIEQDEAAAHKEIMRDDPVRAATRIQAQFRGMQGRKRALDKEYEVHQQEALAALEHGQDA